MGHKILEFNDICKSYRVARREPGFCNAVESVFKREYDTIHAINHISFSISDGEMVGYIGPNGAGKSTTIKILSGILTPDSGTCVVNGQVPWKDRKEYVRQIGVVFGQRSQLWWDIPIMDSFELLQTIYSIPAPRDRNRPDEMTIGAKSHGKYPIDIYGKGILRFCTYVIPYTLIQYYPLQFLLGKSRNRYRAFYPLGVIVFLLICYSVWRFGVKHYKSCGS